MNQENQEQTSSPQQHLPPLLWILLGAILATVCMLAVYTAVLGFKVEHLEHQIEDAIHESDKTIIDYFRDNWK